MTIRPLPATFVQHYAEPLSYTKLENGIAANRYRPHVEGATNGAARWDYDIAAAGYSLCAVRLKTEQHTGSRCRLRNEPFAIPYP